MDRINIIAVTFSTILLLQYGLGIAVQHTRDHGGAIGQRVAFLGLLISLPGFIYIVFRAPHIVATNPSFWDVQESWPFYLVILGIAMPLLGAVIAMGGEAAARISARQYVYMVCAVWTVWLALTAAGERGEASEFVAKHAVAFSIPALYAYAEAYRLGKWAVRRIRKRVSPDAAGLDGPA